MREKKKSKRETIEGVETVECSFAPHAPIFCSQSSRAMTCAFSAGPAPTSTASRPFSRVKCSCRGRSSMMSWGVPRPSRTLQLPRYSALTSPVVARANVRTLRRSRSGRRTSQPHFSTAASSVGSTGVRTEHSVTSLSRVPCPYHKQLS